MNFIKEDILNEMAMDKTEAIDRCISLGEQFIKHFRKIMDNPNSSTINHWMNEMQIWFNKVIAIKLKPNSKHIPFNKLMDWFFTVGADPEDYVSSQYVDDYDTFIIELYKCKNVKKSFDYINIKFENS